MSLIKLQLIAAAVFLAIWKFDALAFLYDIRILENGIEFLLFSSIRISFLSYSDIEYVEELKGGYLRFAAYAASVGAVSFKNRIFHKLFLIKKWKGLLTRRILVTPKNPVAFRRSLANAGVRLIQNG